MPSASAAQAGDARRADEVRVLLRWMALGAAAGALSGLIVGGLGGRLLMLALRERSPEVTGIVSDAGFEMGRFTLSGSLQLAAVTTVLGAMAGLAYVAGRLALPAIARVPAATLLGATVGGVALIDPDGIDLLLIEPPDLAAAGFIALPAVGAMAIALLVETGARRAPGAMTGSWVVPPTRLRLAARLCATVLVLVLVVAEGRILVEEIGRIP